MTNQEHLWGNYELFLPQNESKNLLYSISCLFIHQILNIFYKYFIPSNILYIEVVVQIYKRSD